MRLGIAVGLVLLVGSVVSQFNVAQRPQQFADGVEVLDIVADGDFEATSPFVTAPSLFALLPTTEIRTSEEVVVATSISRPPTVGRPVVRRITTVPLEAFRPTGRPDLPISPRLRSNSRPTPLPPQPQPPFRRLNSLNTRGQIGPRPRVSTNPQPTFQPNPPNFQQNQQFPQQNQQFAQPNSPPQNIPPHIPPAASRLPPRGPPPPLAGTVPPPPPPRRIPPQNRPPQHVGTAFRPSPPPPQQQIPVAPSAAVANRFASSVTPSFVLPTSRPFSRQPNIPQQNARGPQPPQPTASPPSRIPSFSTNPPVFPTSVSTVRRPPPPTFASPSPPRSFSNTVSPSSPSPPSLQFATRPRAPPGALPPGVIPPSNAVIDELNRATDFMAVAARLQLRRFARHRNRRRADFIERRLVQN